MLVAMMVAAMLSVRVVKLMLLMPIMGLVLLVVLMSMVELLTPVLVARLVLLMPRMHHVSPKLVVGLVVLMVLRLAKNDVRHVRALMMAPVVSVGAGLVASMCLLHERALGLGHVDNAFRVLGKLAVDPVRGEVEALLAVRHDAVLMTGRDGRNLAARLHERRIRFGALLVAGPVCAAAVVALPSSADLPAKVLLPVLMTVEDVLHVWAKAVATMVPLGTSLVAGVCFLHERALFVCHCHHLFRSLSKLVVEPFQGKAWTALAVLAVAGLVTSFDGWNLAADLQEGLPRLWALSFACIVIAA